jgi:hypothetical protein
VGGVIGAGVGSPSGPGAVATTALGAGAGGVLGEDVRQMLEQAIFHEHIGGKESAIGMAKQGTLQAATAGAGVALGSIPMKSVAGKLLASVEKDAGHLPVNLTHSSDELLRVKELADAGGTMPTAIRKLLARATEPGGRPLTYSEMRNYYSNITSLSAREKMGLSPIMRRQLGITAAALKQDIADTAAVVGRSADYFHGMREYAQAAKLERAATEMKKWAIRAAGVGATAELAKLVWNTGPPKAAGVRR